MSAPSDNYYNLYQKYKYRYQISKDPIGGGDIPADVGESIDRLSHPEFYCKHTVTGKKQEPSCQKKNLTKMDRNILGKYHQSHDSGCQWNRQKGRCEIVKESEWERVKATRQDPEQWLEQQEWLTGQHLETYDLVEEEDTLVSKCRKLTDNYTPEILRTRYQLYLEKYLETERIKRETSLDIRQENPPEDITENIAKFIIRKTDPTCKWAKGDVRHNKKRHLRPTGDLCSETQLIPEVKSFTSKGCSSFGPKKVFTVIYFLDLREFLQDRFVLWKVNLTNESPEWKQLRVSVKQTHQDQCAEGRRPRISWDKIYPQIRDHCEMVYDGSFDDIFS